MEFVKNDIGRVHLKSWCPDVEEGAMEQATNLCNLPFVYHHIALMPDCHQGYGMPIGGVMATEGVIVPNAVGVDIGCGMCAVKVLDYIPERDTLKKIMGDIRKVVPVGFKKHKEKQEDSLMPELPSEGEVVGKHYDNANVSLGTLGGGNHFIELQKDFENNMWVMIHSGSRNVGKQVCDYYNWLAKQHNEMWHTSVDPNNDLAFLPYGTWMAEHYTLEMQWCVDFALANRNLMLQRAVKIIANTDCWPGGEYPINIAHNYAVMENHFGKNVIVHRKGATLAREGTVGIIPGSQGTPSYIVKGLGNKDSFDSCSHGAGRCMSRKKAKNTLDLQTEIDKMGDIIHGMRSKDDLDEASSAYKNIDAVMESQDDLVDVVTKLVPLAVIKG